MVRRIGPDPMAALVGRQPGVQDVQDAVIDTSAAVTVILPVAPLKPLGRGELTRLQAALDRISRELEKARAE